MAKTQDIKTFSKDETVEVTLLLRNRDGTVITSAATVAVDLVISKDGTSDAVYEFDTTPQIILADAPTGQWNVTLEPADVVNLKEGAEYRYDVWSTGSGGTPRLHQITGVLQLQKSTPPS